jgi:aspartate/methionine/tyrosine aminotransferase
MTLNLSSGEAGWNPFAELGIPPESFSDSELDGASDELGFSTLRDAYCRVALGATLDELREHGLDILITHGAKEAFWTISATLRNPQRGLLLPQVAWPGYGQVATGLGLPAVHYDFSRPASSVARMTRGGPALLLVNSPHNPSGFELQSDDRAQLERAAASSNCELVFDETLRTFGSHVSAERRLGQKLRRLAGALRIDSVSKWLGMPGLRVGFVTGARTRLLELAQYRDRVSSGVCSLAQAAVAKVLHHPSLQAALAVRLRGLRSTAAQLAALLRAARCELAGDFPLYAWARPEDPRALSNGVLTLPGCQIEVADGARFGAPGWFRSCPHGSSSIIASLQQGMRAQ